MEENRENRQDECNLADFYNDNSKIADDEISLLQEQFRRINLKIQLVVILVTFCFEFLYYFIPQSNINSSFFRFVLKYVFTPFFVNIIIYAAARHYHYNEACRSQKCKNYIVMLSSLFQAIVYVVVHQVFATINGAFIVIILLSAVYNDKRLTRIITCFSLAGILLSTFIIRYDAKFVLTADYMLDSMVICFIVIITHITAELIFRKNDLERTKILNAIQEKEKYWHGMMVDSLSGLYSRVAFRPYIDKVKKEPGEYCVAILDIDNFKHLNDTFGHPYGDDVIRYLGKTLKLYYGDRFIAFRYGGEEFACVIRSGAKEAAVLLNEMRDAFQHECSAQLGNGRITFSGGIAVFSKQNPVSDIIRQADCALYQAKNSGKNKIVIYEEARQDSLTAANGT